MSKMLAGWSVSWLGGLGGTHHHIIHTHRSIIETSRKDLGLATYSVWAALFVRPHNQNAALWWPISIYLLIQQPTRPTTLPLYYYSVAAEIGFPEWDETLSSSLDFLPPRRRRRRSQDALCVCARRGYSRELYNILTSALLAPQVPPLGLLFVLRELLEIPKVTAHKKGRV